MQRTKLLEPNTFISAFRNNRSAIKLLLDTILHTSKPLTNISLTIKHTELYNSKITVSLHAQMDCQTNQSSYMLKMAPAHSMISI